MPDLLLPILHYLITIISANIIITIISANIIITIIIDIVFIFLQSSDVLDLLVPILHYLNDARADQARVGLMHIGRDF